MLTLVVIASAFHGEDGTSKLGIILALYEANHYATCCVSCNNFA